MTRKHFTLIAATIRHERELAVGRGESVTASDALVRALCRDFRASNLNFNRFLFLAAAGVPE